MDDTTQVAAPDPGPDEEPGTALATSGGGGRWRAAGAAVCLVLGLVLLPVATAGFWVQRTVTNTSQYVDTVAPLATDPAVVDAVERRLSTKILQVVADQHLLAKAAQALEAKGVPPAVATALTLLSDPLQQRVQQLVDRAVKKVVENPAFADAWREANRVAHEQLIAVLSGDTKAIDVSSDNTVSIKVATLATAIKTELTSAGVPFADKIPEVQGSFPIGTVQGLSKAQRAYDLLHRVGRILPILVLLLLGGGLALARDRRRALVRMGAGGVVAALLVPVALAIGRHYYLGALPAQASVPAASAVYDTIVLGLREYTRVVIVVMLLLFLGAVLTGPSKGATLVRTQTRTWWDKGR
jgi:hypothetical protein